VAGGGAILNVDSLALLDRIMGEFPFGPFSKVKVGPVTDLSTSTDNLTRQLEQAVQGMPH
jgi:hypothetical protein